MKSMKYFIVALSLLCSTLAFTQPIIDTLEYPEAKATQLLAVTCNVPSEFSGYAQYYDAPEQVIVHGFVCYAGVNSTNNLDTANITGYLFSANVDSTPGSILRQKDFQVDNTYSLAQPHIMKRVVNFDAPDTLQAGEHFLVGLQTTTNLALGILTNDYNAGDGLGEELGFWHWTGDNTWYASGAFFTWDVDFIIMPIVEYSGNAAIQGPTQLCPNDSACYTYQNSLIFNHRMYNEDIFNSLSPLDQVDISWGDGSQSNLTDTCHIWPSGSNYTIISSSPTGWNNSIIYDSLELSVGQNFEFTEQQTSCDSYTWALNGTTYTNSIIDTVMLTSIQGCDSMVILDLTINSVDVNIIQNGFDLTADVNGANYQWIDCANGNLPISGATSQVYLVEENGSYGVIATLNGCSDTSDCVTIGSVDINELDINEFRIQPNPSNGLVQISGINNLIDVDIIDVSGRRIEFKQESSSDIEVNLRPGVYMVRFKQNQFILKSERLIVY